MSYILATGNPKDGFQYIGPFDTADEASGYALDHLSYEWWTIELDPPTE